MINRSQKYIVYEFFSIVGHNFHLNQVLTAYVYFVAWRGCFEATSGFKTRRQLPNVGVQDDARYVLNAGIWLYQPPVVAFTAVVHSARGLWLELGITVN